MDEKTLYEQARKLMMSGVDRVISGEDVKYTSDVISPKDIADYLVSHHNAEKGYFEDLRINGWQGDFWATVLVREKHYTIESSAYFPTTSFYQHEEEDSSVTLEIESDYSGDFEMG